MNDPSVDITTRLIDEVVARVRSALGADRLLSVFLGGSVAAGETAWCAAGGIVEVYSDVDLYVVVEDGTDPDDAAGRCREAVRGVPLHGEGYRFFRAPDVGVYTFSDLASQPARPGTVGLDSRHRILIGDPQVPIRAAAEIGESIAVEEALYLLENRLTELAVLQHERKREGRSPDPGDDRYYAFVVCKTGLDVGAARLVANGGYTARRRDQWERLQSHGGDGRDDDGGWTAIVARCAEATASMPAADWADGVPPEETAETVVAAALSEWKRIASVYLAAEGEDWSEMVLRRCHTGEYLNNFRQFRALNARCGFKRRGALVTGVHLSRYSPVDALRLSALMEYLYRDAAIRPGSAALLQTLGPFLDRLTHTCGFSEGSLAERSYAMYRAIT